MPMWLFWLTVAGNLIAMIVNVFTAWQLRRPSPRRADTAHVQITPEQMFETAKAASTPEEFFLRLAQRFGPWGARP